MGQKRTKREPDARQWRNRIVGSGEVDAEQLLANPKNWRIHPKAQQEALAGVLDAVGWVQNVIVNQRTGFVVDGHARVAMAISRSEKVPVVYVDLSEQEEALILATLDPLTSMAGTNKELLSSLCEGMDEAFKALIESCGNLLPPGAVAGEDDLPDPGEPVTQPGDLWILGDHRVLCEDATSPQAVARLLGDKKPFLMVTDPPYGIELDSEWRDRAGLNGCGPAEASYMTKRTTGHTQTKISGDTRADWSSAFELVPSLQVAYVWHASSHTVEVAMGLERIGFLYPQQIIWNKGRAVLTRTLYWFQHEPCWFVRKKNAPWYGTPGENSTVWDSPSPKFVMGASVEEKFDHPTQKPVELMRRPILNHTKRSELVYEPFLGSGTTLAAAELTGRVCYGLELDPKYVDLVVKRWEMATGKTAELQRGGGA